MSVFYIELGKKLKEIRKSQNKTQQDIANYLRIARQNVGTYEKGIKTLDVDTFYMICDFLKVEPSEVMKDLRKLIYKK